MYSKKQQQLNNHVKIKLKQKKEEEGSKSSIFCFFYFFSKTILGLDLFKNDDFFKVGFLVVVNSDLLS